MKERYNTKTHIYIHLGTYAYRQTHKNTHVRLDTFTDRQDITQRHTHTSKHIHIQTDTQRHNTKSHTHI